MLWVCGPDVPGAVTTLLKPLGLGLPNRSSKRRLLPALSTNSWGLWGSQAAKQQMEDVFLHRLASSSRFTCEMPSLWASLLFHPPETSCQHVFCSYLSQPTFWASSVAPREELRSAKSLLWHGGWKWVMAACLSSFIQQTGCSESLSLWAAQLKKFPVVQRLSGSVDRKAKITCLLAWFEWASPPSMCTPQKGLLSWLNLFLLLCSIICLLYFIHLG